VGLGEAIVQGLVIPDRYRIAPNGKVLEQTSGFRQLAVRQHPDGQTHQEPVSRELAEEPCLDSRRTLFISSSGGRSLRPSSAASRQTYRPSRAVPPASS
jgi:hypothetical protein